MQAQKMGAATPSATSNCAASLRPAIVAWCRVDDLSVFTRASLPAAISQIFFDCLGWNVQMSARTDGNAELSGWVWPRACDCRGL